MDDTAEAARSEGESGTARWLEPRRWIREPVFWVAGAGLVFAAVLGAIGELRYWAFDTYAWDLGNYNQAFYTTVAGHRLFYYTGDLPAGTGGSLFAVHFAPFLFLLVPFYALAPGPTTLLVLQAVGLGLGAVPAYGLAKSRLASARWGYVFAGAYLLSPVVQGFAWYDFHPEAFLPVTVLTALWALERKRTLLFLALWALALSIVETADPFLALFALLALLATFWPSPTPTSSERARDRTVLLLALSIALVWLGVATVVVASFNTPYGGAFGLNHGVDWNILGAPSALWVFPTAVLHPSSAWAALSFDTSQKILFLLLLFGSVGFLPWLGEDRYLLPTLVWVGMALLSNNAAYYELGDQYAAYVFPFLLAGAMGGVAFLRGAHLRAAWRERLGRWTRKVPRPRLPLRGPRISRGMLVATWVAATVVVTAAVASPLLPSPQGDYAQITYGLPPTSGGAPAALHRVLSYLPPAASVLTTTAVFPEVSDRSDAYVLPTSSYFAGSTTFPSAVGAYVNESDYVVVDFVLDLFQSTILTTYANLSSFHVVAADQGAYLYGRGPRSAPELFVPMPPWTIAPGQLTLGNAFLDPSLPGPYGPSLQHLPGLENGSLLWNGEDLFGLPPGNYSISFGLESAFSSSGPQFAVAVDRTPTTVIATPINPSPSGHDYAFSETVDLLQSGAENSSTITRGSGVPGELQETLSLSVAWPSPGILDTEGYVLSAGAQVQLSGIVVTQTAP